MTDHGKWQVVRLADAVASRRGFEHLRRVFADGSDTILKPLAWQGDLCFGPSRDGRATFQGLHANPHWTGLHTVDEAGPRCGMAADIVARVAQEAFGDLKAPPRMVTPPHTPVPFSPVLEDAYVPSADVIAAAIRETTGAAQTA